jgi:ankyrin repeat protein
VSELIAAGADPNHERQYNGRRPLHEAADKDHYTVVKVLLEAGVDPLTPIGLTKYEKDLAYSSPGSPRLALTLACEHGHVEAVDVFLPFLDLHAMHRALSWAAQNGQAAVVRLMLSQPGVEVDAVVRGSTALFKACSKRDLATVKALLEAGADPKSLNEVWGSEFGSYSSGGVLKSNGSYALFTCLQMLCGGVPNHSTSSYDWDDEDCCEITTLLIEAGADIHRQTEDGETVLHSIVQASYYVARVLLDAGASANAVDAKFQTPLYYSQVPACIPLLVGEGGADIDARDLYGNTPLLAALVEHSNEEKILALLQCGANAQVLNRAGDNALHVALKSYYATPVRLHSSRGFQVL